MPRTNVLVIDKQKQAHEVFPSQALAVYYDFLIVCGPNYTVAPRPSQGANEKPTGNKGYASDWRRGISK